LTKELVKLGHDVTVYASGDSHVGGKLVPVVAQALWKVERETCDPMIHLGALARLCREAEQFDIIHSHMDYLAFPYSRFSSVPFVHTMHGRLDLPDLQDYIREFSEARLISISHNQRTPIPRANWLATVYNGIPVDTLPFGSGQGGYLAFVGRISPEKGLAEAIDVAIAAGMPLKIAARMPLSTVDNPSIRQDWVYYRDEIEPRLSHPLIELVGEVDDDEKGPLLADAAALLFPINWPEPFGLVMAEALACGTPVIAVPRGSVPEIVEHGRTGYLCATIEEMVAACSRIDRLDRAACRAVALQRFSQRAMALAYLDVYRSVCAPDARLIPSEVALTSFAAPPI
jgi:glycosyltransferase involved in cell wall biosynthesis